MGDGQSLTFFDYCSDLVFRSGWICIEINPQSSRRTERPYVAKLAKGQELETLIFQQFAILHT